MTHKNFSTYHDGGDQGRKEGGSCEHSQALLKVMRHFSATNF